MHVCEEGCSHVRLILLRVPQLSRHQLGMCVLKHMVLKHVMSQEVG